MTAPSLASSPHVARQEARLRWKVISATTTFVAVDLWLIDVILGDTTAENITINLPRARDMSGHLVYVKKLVAGNTLTIDPSGAELIDGAATLAFTTANQTVLIGAGPTTTAPFVYGWTKLN